MAKIINYLIFPETQRISKRSVLLYFHEILSGLEYNAIFEDMQPGQHTCQDSCIPGRILKRERRKFIYLQMAPTLM
jgi:hypothetical protein